MASIVIFRNNRGGSEILSVKGVRNSLQQLVNGSGALSSGSNSLSEGLEESSEGGGINIEMRSFLEKISANYIYVNSDDVRRTMTNRNLEEEIPFLFSMSKEHFLAIIYMIYTGLISSREEISKIINSAEATRTDSILYLLNEESSDIISDCFDSNVSNLFPEDYSQDTFDINSLLNGVDSPLLMNESAVITPEAAWCIFSSYIDRIFGGSSADRNSWAFDNLFTTNESWNIASVYPYDYFSFYREAWSLWSASVNKTIYPSYKSWLDTYTKANLASKYKTPLINLSKLNGFITNSLVPIVSAAALQSRFSHANNETLAFTSKMGALMQSLVNRSVFYTADIVLQYSPSRQFTRVFSPLYMDFAYWVYNNTDNIASEEKSAAYWEELLKQIGSTNLLRTSVPNAATSGGFTYISDPVLKRFLQRLFKDGATASERASEGFIGELFTSRLDRTIVPSIPIPIRLIGLSLLSSSMRRAAEEVASFGMLARDNGTVVRFGPRGLIGYIREALRVGLAYSGYSNQELLGKANFADIRNYIQSRITAVKESILERQNGSPLSGADYNYLMGSSQHSLDIYRIFAAELAESFLNYLVSGFPQTETRFTFSLSADGLKKYRLLNFIKHTIIGMEKAIRAVQSTQLYNQFVYMVVANNSGLDKKSFDETLSDGTISTSELRRAFTSTIRT
jgi:X-X-X-Leu-X-X-Gly heptad repeat protein